MRNRSGFTLIELLIIVVLMGIMAAVAIPRFSSNQRAAYTTVRKIVSDLRYTRSFAISSGNRYYLQFTNPVIVTDPVNGSYTKYEMYQIFQIGNPSDVQIGENRSIPANVTCTVTTDPAGNRFSFSYLGECNNGNGTDRIELKDEAETNAIIVIDLTGRASTPD